VAIGFRDALADRVVEDEAAVLPPDPALPPPPQLVVNPTSAKTAKQVTRRMAAFPVRAVRAGI